MIFFDLLIPALVQLYNFQEVHGDALQMREATKEVLLRHEHTANTVSKSRQRQAFDFRRQVEERKVELERLERKLFATSNTNPSNTPTLTVIENILIFRSNIHAPRKHGVSLRRYAAERT